MIALGFCSFGGANNPVCFSYIPHQSEGEKLYTKTYYEMQSAVMALLKAETRKTCEFSTYMKMLKSRPEVVKYLAGEKFKENKLPVDQTQCDSFLDGHAFHTRCLDFQLIFVGITLPVNIAL